MPAGRNPTVAATFDKSAVSIAFDVSSSIAWRTIVSTFGVDCSTISRENVEITAILYGESVTDVKPIRLTGISAASPTNEPATLGVAARPGTLIEPAPSNVSDWPSAADRK